MPQPVLKKMQPQPHTMPNQNQASDFLSLVVLSSFNRFKSPLSFHYQYQASPCPSRLAHPGCFFSQTVSLISTVSAVVAEGCCCRPWDQAPPNLRRVQGGDVCGNKRVPRKHPKNIQELAANHRCVLLRLTNNYEMRWNKLICRKLQETIHSNFSMGYLSKCPSMFENPMKYQNTPNLQQILQLLRWRKLDDVSLLLCLLDTRKHWTFIKASNANQSPHAFHLALAS